MHVKMQPFFQGSLYNCNKHSNKQTDKLKERKQARNKGMPLQFSTIQMIGRNVNVTEDGRFKINLPDEIIKES